MKYFIFQSNQIKEVEESYYETWHNLFADQYMLEDYSFSDGEMVHYLETMFVGALDKEEQDNPLPFVIVYFKDKLTLTDESIESNLHDEDIFYYGTYDEMVEARKNLIENIESVND